MSTCGNCVEGCITSFTEASCLSTRLVSICMVGRLWLEPIIMVGRPGVLAQHRGRDYATVHDSTLQQRSVRASGSSLSVAT